MRSIACLRSSARATAPRWNGRSITARRSCCCSCWSRRRRWACTSWSDRISSRTSTIDIQVIGRDRKNYEIAQEIQRRVTRIRGAVDVHLHQPLDVPELRIDVDRIKAGEMGLTQSDVANSVLVSLSGNAQTAPN